MLLAASNIYKELAEKNVLGRITEILDDMNYKNYKIVVTGHSLGAGTAAVLGFFLRSEQKICDRVRVYAYGVPGGLLNASAREESKKFVISIIHNDDIISRLSIRSVIDMRNHIRQVLRACEEPKYKIVSAGYFTGLQSICCCFCNSKTEEVQLKDK